jgi:glycosyltransferase involved in cell wall biosynthesis
MMHGIDTTAGAKPPAAANNGDRPLRVCLFPGELQLGGVGRNTLNLANELLTRGVLVDLFLSKRAGVYLSQVPDEVTIVEGGGSVSRSLPHLARYLRKRSPDVLISARPHINIVAIVAKRLARVPTKVVVTERTTDTAADPRSRSLYGRFVRAGCRLLYPFADHVVAVSEAVADGIVRGIGIQRERVDVIHNPVVGSRLEELARAPLNDSWVESSSSPIILGVGRLTRQKDFHTLVRAFAEVSADREVRLVILGEGEERVSLEALARELNVASDVHLPGYVDNPYAYLARAGVFVLSSRWEGLPTVLIEAMALGTPVISTDCPGGSREILADGDFGALLPVGDVTAMAHAIRSALERPGLPERLMERARDFSATRSADRYLALSRPGPGPTPAAQYPK